MHGLKVAWLAMASLNLLAGSQLELKVLSSKPDMVTGGRALVELSGAPFEGVHISLNGQDVTQAFRPAARMAARRTRCF